MNYDNLRTLVSPMLRASETTLPHPEYFLTVDFSESGYFVVRHELKRAAIGGSSKPTKSLKEVINYILQFYKVEVGNVYQHVNGNIYEVIAIANELSTRPEYPPTVVYKSTSNNRVWAKPLSNFIRKMTRIK